MNFGTWAETSPNQVGVVKVRSVGLYHGRSGGLSKRRGPILLSPKGFGPHARDSWKDGWVTSLGI